MVISTKSKLSHHQGCLHIHVNRNCLIKMNIYLAYLWSMKTSLTPFVIPEESMVFHTAFPQVFTARLCKNLKCICMFVTLEMYQHKC